MRRKSCIEEAMQTHHWSTLKNEVPCPDFVPSGVISLIASLSSMSDSVTPSSWKK